MSVILPHPLHGYRITTHPLSRDILPCAKLRYSVIGLLNRIGPTFALLAFQRIT